VSFSFLGCFLTSGHPPPDDSIALARHTWDKRVVDWRCLCFLFPDLFLPSALRPTFFLPALTNHSSRPFGCSTPNPLLKRALPPPVGSCLYAVLKALLFLFSPITACKPHCLRCSVDMPWRGPVSHNLFFVELVSRFRPPLSPVLAFGLWIQTSPKTFSGRSWRLTAETISTTSF